MTVKVSVNENGVVFIIINMYLSALCLNFFE